jgi:hypothetical protein
MEFTFLHPRCTLDHWGYIPGFLREDDPRPARVQINERYQGRWRPFKGHTLGSHNELHYPGDPPQYPVSVMRFREERLFLYQPGDWVLIMQPDGSWEVARMD